MTKNNSLYNFLTTQDKKKKAYVYDKIHGVLSIEQMPWHWKLDLVSANLNNFIHFLIIFSSNYEYIKLYGCVSFSSLGSPWILMKMSKFPNLWGCTNVCIIPGERERERERKFLVFQFHFQAGLNDYLNKNLW